MPVILRLSNRYELAPIVRGDATFSFVIDVLEEISAAGPALLYRVYRKDFFRLHPSTFDGSAPDPGSYADEELSVEDMRFDGGGRFIDEKSALEHAVREIEAALSVSSEASGTA